MAKVYGKIAKPKNISEAFSGEVYDEEVKFPRELGVEHPFDFKVVEELYKTHPFAKGAVDKHLDSIASDFNIEVDNKNVKALIKSFMDDSGFNVLLRRWVMSALVSGNGFLELDLKNGKVQVLDPKTMFVRRNKKGEVLGYNQYNGEFKHFQKNRSKVIPFSTNQIAHLKLNCLPGEAYGYGIIWPNFKTLASEVRKNKNLNLVMDRKAGSPYHIKVGIPGEAVNDGDLEQFMNNLQYLTNTHEWVTDANTDIKVIDFGEIGEHFTAPLEYDNKKLVYGFQVPEVLMGSGSIPEGLAKVQLEAFQRRIQSYQEDIEKIIEDYIFKPYLQINGFQDHVEIVWNLPGETEINNRIDRLSSLLTAGMNVSPNMQRMLELELANILELKDAEKYLNKPDKDLKQIEDNKTKTMQDIDNPKNPLNKEETPDKEKKEKKEKPNEEREAEETQIKQPEVPGAKVVEAEKQDLNELEIKEWVNLMEIEGFNYLDYLSNILAILKVDEFKDLKAITEKDISLGLLPEKDIEKLRIIMKDGFKQNKTIKQIEKDIKNYVDIPDRKRINESGEEVLALSAKERPNVIARTETVRLANEGLIKTFEDAKIDQVQWLAALSDRTCPICAEKDGTIYPIQESHGLIPAHSSCRCSWLPVI